MFRCTRDCKRLYSILTVLVALLLTGCWDMREIDQRAVALAVGVDSSTESDGVTITMQYPIPPSVQATSGGAEANNDLIFTMKSEGETLTKAIHNANLRLSRRNDFSHLQAIIIGEELARDRFAEVVAEFARDPVVERSTHVLIAEGKAESAVKTEPPQERASGQYFVTYFEKGNKEARVQPTPLWRVMATIARKSHAIAIPVVRSSDTQIGLSGIAVVKGGRMIASFDFEESIGLLWALGDAIREVLVVESPTGDSISIKTFDSDSRIIPQIVDGEPRFDVRVVIEGQIAGEYPARTLTSERLQHYEVLTANWVKQSVEDMLKIVQKDLRADLLGLGHRLWARHPDYFQQLDWEETFPHVPVTVTVKAFLRRTGTTF